MATAHSHKSMLVAMSGFDMRLVLISGLTYTVYEGRKMIAQFIADAPLNADEIEKLRNFEI